MLWVPPSVGELKLGSRDRQALEGCCVLLVWFWLHSPSMWVGRSLMK